MDRKMNEWAMETHRPNPATHRKLLEHKGYCHELIRLQRQEIKRLEEENDGLLRVLQRIRDGEDRCHGIIIADMGYQHFAKHTAKIAIDSVRKDGAK